MAKKCPNCNSTRTQKQWNRTSSSGPELWGYYCFNCGNYFKPSGRIAN